MPTNLYRSKAYSIDGDDFAGESVDENEPAMRRIMDWHEQGLRFGRQRKCDYAFLVTSDDFLLVIFGHFCYKVDIKIYSKFYKQAGYFSDKFF